VGTTDFVNDSTQEIKALTLKGLFTFIETENYTVTASVYSADGSTLIDEESVSFSGAALPSATVNEHYGTVDSDILIDPFPPDGISITLIKEGGAKLDDEYQFKVSIHDSTGIAATLGPTNIHTSGSQPLEVGMDFGDFEVKGINETATGYLKYRVISLKATYSFAENDTVSLRATAYNMDGASIVDEETTTFQTAQLPIPAINYIHGSRNGNLSIDKVTEGEIYLTLAVPQEARLASEYQFEIEVNDGSGSTVIGPTTIHTSASLTIEVGSVFENYVVTSLIEALGTRPAATTNDYGFGRSVVVTFDIEQSADVMADTSLLESLLVKSTRYVTPFVQASGIAGGLTQVTITAENDAAIPIAADVTETLPLDFEVVDSAGGTITTNASDITIDWTLSLAGNSGEDLLIVLRAPDAVGDYNTVSDLEFDLGDGHLEPIDPVQLLLSITMGASNKADDVIAELDALNITSQPDINRRANARALIISARDRLIASKDDLHENIKDILKAGDELIKIESVDAGDVRIGLGELLRINEIRYYLY
jgi:hypothetical protein